MKNNRLELTHTYICIGYVCTNNTVLATLLVYYVSVQRYLFVLVDDIGNFIFIVKNVQGKEVIGEELVIKCWVKNKR